MKTVRIPGKVMLSGEYAVLYGGTAVLVPVPRFLRISEAAGSSKEKYNPVVKEALSLEIPEIENFEREQNLPSLDIDRLDFFQKNTGDALIKLGLGCSAAEAVGVIVLRFERAGISWKNHPSKITGYAMKAHRKAQGGKGSGADVAVCAFGKPIRFKKNAENYRVEPVDKKKSCGKIPMSLVHSGVPADTRNLVRIFENWADRGGNQAKELISKLVNSSNALAEAWFVENQERLFRLIDDFTYTMKQCAGTAGIDYETPVHKELEDWAKKHNGCAKPTGAGGGDMILLIGDLPINELQRPIISLPDFTA